MADWPAKYMRYRLLFTRESLALSALTKLSFDRLYMSMLNIPTHWFSRGSKISGCASILGSWQICHQVCTALVAVLATIGIAVGGMPLLFLNKWQWPLWIAAVALFGVLLTIRVGARMKCITTRGMVGNVGLLMAGAPFEMDSIGPIRLIGLIVVLAVLVWYMKDLVVRRTENGGVVIDLVEQGRKVVGGVVGVVAVSLLLVTHNPSPPPLILRGGEETNTPLKVRGVGGVLKFTLFDIAQAKELMDKNNDGQCDACGMAIDQCIESGMMQCTMDPEAKIGLLQSAHIHAAFHVFQDGKELDLTSYGHRMGGNDDGKSSSFLHVEGPNFNKLHMHATGVPLKMWFDSVGLAADGATVMVNGTKAEMGLEYVFNDGDEIIVKPK